MAADDLDNMVREQMMNVAGQSKFAPALSKERKTGVRSLCIVLCVLGVTMASSVLWGFWAGVLAFSASYGLACLFDGIESAGWVDAAD